MTIKLKNVVFNNVDFVNTIKKIYKQELPSKEAYRLFTLLREINKKAEEYDEIKNKILKETAVYNESNNTWQFDNKDKSNKFKEQFDDLLDIEFTLDNDKIQYPIALNISAYEMEILKDLFNYDNLDE